MSPPKSTVFNFDEYYNPNYGYEPYWKDGDWVFMEPKQLTTDPSSTKTTPHPTICGDECTYLYRRIKHVCARNLDNVDPGMCHWYANECEFTSGFKTFDTYCQFLDTKCKTTKNLKDSWVFVHRGKCETNAEKVFYPMHQDRDPVRRLTSIYAHLTELYKGSKRTPFG
ncbi:hypothetical protein K1T71_011012 [Dendrolimus kikuchii]|uniref:Uncharacterized protein n=1 Tax=Dendrolimus kikuchii TaxID=765133 RepID=A0ACC1CQM4_9NEOP|nr:hypothetical protein K1T71_011012 [Dendrolimus kikuchii]